MPFHRTLGVERDTYVRSGNPEALHGAAKAQRGRGWLILGITESFLEEDTLDLTGRLNDCDQQKAVPGQTMAWRPSSKLWLLTG